jgi:predicted nucleic-acid-binding Zn-ribbon protein
MHICKLIINDKLDDRGLWSPRDENNKPYTDGQVVSIFNPNTNKVESYVYKRMSTTVVEIAPYLDFQNWTFIIRKVKKCKQCSYYYKKYIYSLAISTKSLLESSVDAGETFNVTCTVPEEAYQLTKGEEIAVVFT